MSIQDFMAGPFEFAAGQTINYGGSPMTEWAVRYGRETIACKYIEASTRAQVIAQLWDAVTRWKTELMDKPEQLENPNAGCSLVELVRVAPGSGVVCHGDYEPVGPAFLQHSSIEALTSGLPDDRYEFWAVDQAGKRCMPIDPDEFERLQQANRQIGELMQQLHNAELQRNSDAHLQYGWVSKLLPDDVLTQDPADWRAPTSWEIRHIVGENSMTGITGAEAAELVGVTPSNFRKYTAADGARSRQNMSYAMWHLLLHRLDVQRMPHNTAGVRT